MSCCGFENATGISNEDNLIITSNILYNEILINCNLCFNNSSNYTSNSSNILYKYSSNNSNFLFNNIGGTSNDFKNFSNQIKGWINSNEDSNYIYFHNSNNTIINSNSELFVFHNSNVLIPFDETKYWSVEDKLTSNIIETNLIKFDFGLLQTAITTLTNFISTIQAEVSALEASDLVMAGSLVAIENQIQTINAILSELDISLNSLYPLEIVDKNIQLNYNQEQFNLISSNLNIKSITQNIPANRPSYTNGILNIINDTTAYIKFIEDGTITFPSNTSINLLLVGAGGDGGAGFYSGGGGGGEVIYKTSYTISAGTYSIQVGQSSIIPNNRISKIYQGATNLVLAKGGGDGGFYDKINDSIYNYFLYKSVIGRVNNINDYTFIEGGNKIIFKNGYIEINGVKDKSYPLLSTNPIYWYKLDTNAFLINSGVYGGAGDLTNTGATIDTTNFIKGSSSVFFNSFNNASLTLNISLNLRYLQTTTGFSISLWTFLKSTNNTSSFIFNIDNGINRTRFLSLTKLYQYLQFEVQYDNNYQYLTNGDDVVNIFNNSWYFITITFATNNDIKFYINNELKGTLNFIFPNVNLTRFSIGGLTNNYFDGNVDDFRFYTSCLTNDEIKELYNGSVIINSPATSGGSGGGSGDLSQSKGLKGTPFDFSSLINDGYDFVNDLDAFGNPDIDYGGGNGGSALANGNGYTELITGTNEIVSKGGLGNTNTYYYPEPKTNYGDGGDGNGGVGFQGIIIIKIPYEAPQTTFNGYTYWSNINDISTTFPISLSGTKQIGLNYDGTLVMNGNSLSVASGSGSKWSSLGTNIYNNNLSGNIGIGTTNPLYKLDVKGDIKGDKLLIGNITTPNIAYQLEMTGDLNLNMLYLNSTSLTSLLNQKQGNLTFNNPLLNTTNSITLKKDASLTLDGSGQLSVVKTATTPIIITGNNFSLNYDSTLTLSGNNLKVSDATASKWITSGTNIYNNNTGNVGINTTNPSYKLHIEDGSVFIGDSGIGNGSQTDNGYKLFFDSSYTATGANKCNKIILHKNDNAPTYIAGFGIEAQGLAYSVWTGAYHNFYTSATTSSGGFLSCSIYRDNFKFYGSTNAGAGGVISNGNAGSSGYSYLSLANDTGNGILFLNSSTKTTDGGANTLTLRNDITGGDLRLSANLDTPYIYLKKSTGRVGISHINPTSRFTIKTTYDDVDSGLCLDSSDNGTNNKYNFKIYSYVVGAGAVGVKFRIVNNTSTTTDAIVIDHSGNVGIGCNPSYKLDVNGSLNSTSLYIATRLIQTHLFNNSGRTHSTYTNFNTPTDFGCHFIQGTTNSPNVNGAGQYYSMSLGLGSEYYNGSPSGNYKTQIAIPRNVGNPYLCVRYMENGGWGGWNKFASGVADNASSSTFSIRSPNESTSSILYLGTPYNSSAPSKCAIIAQAVASYSRSKLHFCLNGTADNSSIYQASLADGSFSFDYDGNMGLMNQSVPNIGGGDYALHLGNSAITTTSGNLIIHKRNNSGGTRLFRFAYDGYFWTTIGDYGNNNSLGSWLHQFSFPYNCPTNSCYLTGSGGMVIAGSLTQNSDIKIKTDIKTIENALWKVQQLRGVEYTHIIEGTRHIGLIAQEVENIIPEVVIEGQKNDIKGVSYCNLVALLIEGMKEMKNEINNLNKRIEILENK